MANYNAVPPKEHQFKKGHKPPTFGGKSKLQLEIEKKVKQGNLEVKQFIFKCLDMNKDELKEYLLRPDTKMFEIILGKLVVKAATGELQAMAYLLDRTYGKPKDNPELLQSPVQPDPNSQNNTPIFRVELNERGKFVNAGPRLLDEDERTIDVESSDDQGI